MRDPWLCTEKADGIRVRVLQVCLLLAGQHHHRSEFHEEFEDATHYGWQVNSSPQFNWNHMVKKKVLPGNAAS